jgi:hypothetical protein
MDRKAMEAFQQKITEARGVMPRIVPGEYDMVSRASRDVDALRLAHATPINRKEATKLLRTLAEHYLPLEHRADFRIVIGGTKRGRGGFILERKRAIRYWRGESAPGAMDGTPVYRMARTGRRLAYVGLPSAEMINGSWFVAGSACLRLGLVLHEFAHVMCCSKGRNVGHGPMFGN